MSFYPVYLTRLNQKKVILLGGNHEAERKTGELLSFDAKVHVISPEITGQMMQWFDKGAIDWTSRHYEYGDFEGAGFVVAADYTDEIAESAAREADERNLLINVMDNIPLSNSAFGSIVKQGKLTVSFSTNGLAPALAVRLKERFQSELDEAYGAFLELSEAMRDPIMESITDADARKSKWYEWVDSETIPLLRKGKRKKALDVTEKIWGRDIMVLAGLRPSGGIIRRLFRKIFFSP